MLAVKSKWIEVKRNVYKPLEGGGPARGREEAALISGECFLCFVSSTVLDWHLPFRFPIFPLIQSESLARWLPPLCILLEGGCSPFFLMIHTCSHTQGLGQGLWLSSSNTDELLPPCSFLFTVISPWPVLWFVTEVASTYGIRKVLYWTKQQTYGNPTQVRGHSSCWASPQVWCAG